MAGKDNADPSSIDKTSFYWAAKCGACHPGGGPTEYDRDGELYFDVTSAQFGYEKLGKTSADVTHDGDYCMVSPTTGSLSMAAWDKTGVSEPDCLLCHRSDRTIADGVDKTASWRQATLRSMTALVDDSGEVVPAYASAATAGQGWWSTLEIPTPPPGKPPSASVLQIDYSVGVADGNLVADASDMLSFSGASITKSPVDYSCWGCHSMAEKKKRGRVWFDADNDVHYAAFSHLDDADPDNDVAASDSASCNRCHMNDDNHNFAKGNIFLGSVNDSEDYANFRTCQECHDGDGAGRDPEAPAYESDIHSNGHMDVMSCELCHIPYKVTAAQLVGDNASTGSPKGFYTDAFLSSDPQDPSMGDASRWYPTFRWKTDKDGVGRLYPAKGLVALWWGDWDQGGTPADYTDDVIEPVILWRVREMTGGLALPGVVDDNGDGVAEVNTEAEIMLYLDALKGVDGYGNLLAENPVLIKGGQVWHEDPANPGTVVSFEFHGTGIPVESFLPFSLDHNVRPTGDALGAAGACGDCHSGFNGGLPTDVFDREILVDPYGVDGQPVYETPRDMLGISVF